MQDWRSQLPQISILCYQKSSSLVMAGIDKCKGILDLLSFTPSFF